MQYNVGAFSKEIENSVPMVAAMMKEIKADAVSANELDSCNTRHMNNQLADLAGEMGGWDFRFSRAMPYRDGAYGVGVTVRDKIIDAMKVNGRHISVDAPFVEGEDNSLLDIMVNDDAPLADRSLVMESLRDEITRALSMLNDRERNIIECFFGIGQPEMTLEEIGERFGLTRERVRQIKEKAIRRLRHNTKNKMLKTYLGQ